MDENPIITLNTPISVDLKPEDEPVALKPGYTAPLSPEGIPIQFTPKMIHILRNSGASKPDCISWGDWLGPKKMFERHDSLAHLVAMGHSPTEAGRRIGLSVNRSHILCSTTRMKNYIKYLKREIYQSEDVKSQLTRLTSKSIRVYEDILDSTSERAAIKAKIAKDILDRNMGKPKETIEIQNSMVRDIFAYLDRAESSNIRVGAEDFSGNRIAIETTARTPSEDSSSLAAVGLPIDSPPVVDEAEFRDNLDKWVSENISNEDVK